GAGLRQGADEDPHVPFQQLRTGLVLFHQAGEDPVAPAPDGAGGDAQQLCVLADGDGPAENGKEDAKGPPPADAGVQGPGGVGEGAPAAPAAVALQVPDPPVAVEPCGAAVRTRPGGGFSREGRADAVAQHSWLTSQPTQDTSRDMAGRHDGGE